MYGLIIAHDHYVHVHVSIQFCCFIPDFIKTYEGLVFLETDTGTKFNNSTTNEQSIPTEQCTANIPEFQSGSQTPCSKLLPGYDWKLLTIYITTNNLTLLKFRFWLV